MTYLCGRCIHFDVCYVPRSIGCVEICGHYKEEPKEPLTEQEYIQTCTTEQLAETILDLCDDRPCFACGIGYCGDENWCHVYSDEAREFVSEWLKQPHRQE